ncbi:39S ribosomal protein L44, mitochondrial [Thrips palmi]|uniref:Large ribosomal subunit protein mL44 n=1 Tax=Thrips palmi TaxID=161013 RepID=A0A6P8YLC9_THRPL|nr:39S ribosomal protein L44, mitochondrial [Thrips palmi]
MAAIRCCLAASKLLNNSIKSCVMYRVTRSNHAPPSSDERVLMLREILRRKKEAGPEKKYHRNTFLEWNYSAELYAFSKRIGENFEGNFLQQAFTQRSYVVKQETLNKDLGLDDPDRFLEDNRSLAAKGEELSRNFVARYLRTALPCLPEEGILHIRDHILKEDNIAKVLCSIGADELILCTDFPTETQTKVSTFYALVGAVEASSGPERGSLFVRDFLITSLSGQDIHALCMPEDKLGALSQIFLREGKEAPEPRIISQVGMNSIIPCYRIGLYSEKKFLGSGAGESIQDGIDNAALNVLWKLWDMPDGKLQFPFDLDVSSVLNNSRSNVPEAEWTSDKVKKQVRPSR